MYTSSNASANVCCPSFSYCNPLKPGFSGYRTQFHICLPSLYFHALRPSSPISIVAAENPGFLSCSILPRRMTETNDETIIIRDFPELRATFARRGNSWKIKLFPQPVARVAKTSFHQPIFLRQAFCSFLSSFMYGKSSRHSLER